MSNVLTVRELQLVQRLTRWLPGIALRADVVKRARPRGPVEYLRITAGTRQVVEIARERIAWPGESIHRLSEATATWLLLQGVLPTYPASAVSRLDAGRLAGISGAVKASFMRLTQFLPTR